MKNKIDFTSRQKYGGRYFERCWMDHYAQISFIKNVLLNHFNLTTSTFLWWGTIQNHLCWKELSFDKISFMPDRSNGKASKLTVS